jgi:hypothetical protein
MQMSYDLTIRSDNHYSQRAKLKPLADFIRSLPYIRANGDPGFALDDRRSRWMEIDLEVVNEDGDNIEEFGQEYSEVNCVELHIPYALLGDAPERDYFPTADAIAKHLGWRVFDEQLNGYRDLSG